MIYYVYVYIYNVWRYRTQMYCVQAFSALHVIAEHEQLIHHLGLSVIL